MWRAKGGKTDRLETYCRGTRDVSKGETGVQRKADGKGRGGKRPGAGKKKVVKGGEKPGGQWYGFLEKSILQWGKYQRNGTDGKRKRDDGREE